MLKSGSQQSAGRTTSLTLAAGPLRYLTLLLMLLGSALVLAADQRVLVMGRLSDDPGGTIGRLQPLLDYVVADLAEFGVERGQVIMARDANQLASYLRQEKVDWVGDTAAVALQLIDRAGAEPIAMVNKRGSKRYRTVLFARTDSDIDTIADLAGKTIAFQNTSSTSAYYLPAGMLLEAGLRPAILVSPLEKPAPGVVGYAFSRLEANSAAWVHKRVVDAAAVSDQDWNDAERIPTSFRDDLRVFAESPEVPRGIELIRSGLPAELREQILETLLNAHQDDEGRRALAAYFRTDQFTEPTSDDLEALYALRPWLRRVREEVE